MDAPSRRPVEVALDAELDRFESAIVRVWLLVLLAAAIASALFALTIAPVMGLGLLATATTYAVWYAWLGWRLSRGPQGRTTRVAAVLIEGSLPWVATLVLVLTKGADYALGSWVPPLIFGALIVSWTARLGGRQVLWTGIAGATAWVLLYGFVMRDALPAALADHALFRPPMQISRALSLLAAGAGGWLAVRALRGAIVRADVASRERELFGKYRLVRKVASGGMGSVYEALYCPEGGFERRVAVKRIHPHLAEQARFVEAFRREAELSARLVHPNIVQVMDFGRVEGGYFLSLEYVDGAPLSAIAKAAADRGAPLDPGVVGYVGREVLAGLAHAHAPPLRVVHRDLCPQNVLVSREGHVKIADFGVARALEDGAGVLTQTFVGHLGYVAPEQAGGEPPIDERADLFPVGVVLWELLAGRPLFGRGGQGATLSALLHAEVPDLLALRPELAPAWGPFFARALARNPAERFADARAMAAALEAIDDAVDPRAAERLAALAVDVPEDPGDEPADDSWGSMG